MLPCSRKTSYEDLKVAGSPLIKYKAKKTWLFFIQFCEEPCSQFKLAHLKVSRKHVPFFQKSSNGIWHSAKIFRQCISMGKQRRSIAVSVRVKFSTFLWERKKDLEVEQNATIFMMLPIWGGGETSSYDLSDLTRMDQIVYLSVARRTDLGVSWPPKPKQVLSKYEVRRIRRNRNRLAFSNLMTRIFSKKLHLRDFYELFALLSYLSPNAWPKEF